MNHRILPPHPPLSPTGGEDKGEGVWIVVPVFNEATSVGAVVAKARRHGPVIVVDDGSTDGSGAVGLSAGAEVLRHGRRRGKGAALRTGVAAAIGRGAAEILTLDGDGQHDPDEIPRLLEDAGRNPRAIVIGGRLHPSGVIPSGRLNALRVSGFFINWLTGTHVQDTQSGFRLYPAELFGEVTLRRGGFVLESEILLAARRAGYDLREVPVTAIPSPEVPETSRNCSATVSARTRTPAPRPPTTSKWSRVAPAAVTLSVAPMPWPSTRGGLVAS